MRISTTRISCDCGHVFDAELVAIREFLERHRTGDLQLPLILRQRGTT
jgi:hypothetical protein